MALVQELMGAGQAVLLSQLLGFNQVEGIVSAGSTISDATQLTGSINVLATVGSSEGVILPALPQPNQFIFVNNQGSNTVKVYSANLINGAAGSTGVSIPTVESGMFVKNIAGTGWWFFPMGT